MNAPAILRSPEHVYTVNGVVYPSVTRILKWAGFQDFSDVPTDRGEFAMERGTAVHAACCQLDDGVLDWDGLDSRLLPFVEAYRDFVADTRFQADLIAHRVFNSVYGYCGELDYAGTFPDRTKAVVDLKTGDGPLQPWVGVQISAYQNCLFAPLTYRRMAVRLRSNGTYVVREFPRVEAVSDWNAFVSALNVVRWKQRNGFKLGE